jgi:hypothetical protein
MKKLVVYLPVLLLIGALMATSASAQEPADTQQVTQEELARVLANVMGLTRFLPSPASPQEVFAIMIVNGVSPADGWVEDAVVTTADLARVIVQAMGMASEIENPDDPQAWVDYLAENGIPIGSIGEAVENVKPLAQPIADYVLAAGLTSDPLRKQSVFGQPDEEQFGTDVALPGRPGVVVSQKEVEDIIGKIPVPRPPFRPVTPDGGEGS